ncbi:MAG: hypothetical protein LBB11_01145 [Puniceicoccales bacterium]|jgi:DNA repair ATPase RecN|nr:hypothetical protein [Puniceicoccales bacterium]
MKRKYHLLVGLALLFMENVTVANLPITMKNPPYRQPQSSPETVRDNWTKGSIRDFLKKEGAIEVCANFLLYTKKELEKMKNHVDQINLLYNNLRKLNLNQINNALDKEIKFMETYYEDCFDKLKQDSLRRDSPYVNCIEHLKKLQSALQNLRNTMENISSTVYLFASQTISIPSVAKNGDTHSTHNLPPVMKDEHMRSLQYTKNEVNSHCMKMTMLIDQVINCLGTLLQVYHEQSYDERSRGNYVTQTNRAL